ncbi:MAG: hypothetical protein ACREO7_16010, partial [Pseudoxanthomonas sp.]
LPSAQVWVVPFAFLYLVFSLVQYFRGSPRWKTMLRALLGFCLFMVASSLISAAAGFALASMPMHG